MMKQKFKTRMQFILTLRNGDISDQNKDEQGHKKKKKKLYNYRKSSYNLHPDENALCFFNRIYSVSNFKRHFCCFICNTIPTKNSPQMFPLK